MSDAPDRVAGSRTVEQPSESLDGPVAVEREPAVGDGDHRAVRRRDDGVADGLVADGHEERRVGSLCVDRRPLAGRARGFGEVPAGVPDRVSDLRRSLVVAGDGDAAFRRFHVRGSGRRV